VGRIVLFFNALPCQLFDPLAGCTFRKRRISAPLGYGSFKSHPKPVSDDDFRVRPGKPRDRGRVSTKQARTLVGQIQRVAKRAGHTSLARGRPSRGTSRNGRGRVAALRLRSSATQRRVVIKARIVRHKGVRFTAAPIARHIAYLQRDGVSRDGRDAGLFDADSGNANGEAFSEKCADDRHHFRFIVSPEDCGELSDVRAFTRDLVATMEKDLCTSLEWVAVDHWNTDNPHVHLLVRGKTEDGQNLVIDRDYIRTGMRARAAELRGD
jgi:hypothetical protein